MVNAFALLVAAGLLSVQAAAAAPPDEPAQRAPSAAAARGAGAAPAGSAAGRDLPAPADVQARYDASLKLLLDGRLAEAALGFEALAQDPAAAAIAERARALAEVSRALDARGAFVPRPAPPEGVAGAPAAEPAAPPPEREPAAPGRRRLDQRGRGELALYASAYGVWAGIGSSVLLDAEDPRVFAATALAGGGAGLALATFGTRGRAMPAGRTQLVEAAGNWGGVNGGLVAGLLDANAKGTVGATLGLGLAGIAGAVALSGERSPSSGDVALATSGAMWGLAAGGLALTFADEPGEKAVLAALLVGTDAGLLAMSLAARNVELSRGRSLLIDAGGLVGTLVGLSIPLFARSERPPAYGIGGLLGMAAGLGLGAHLTRGWDDDPDAERRADAARVMPFLARAPDGKLAAGLAGTF